MAPASDAENFANTTRLLDCFCSWVHYYLFNPTAKGISNWLLLVKKLVGDPPIEHGLVTN
jgi:hypothetical protein